MIRQLAYVTAMGLTLSLVACVDQQGAFSQTSNDVTTKQVVTETDTTPPMTSLFSIPSTSATLIVSPIVFTATDNVGVTGYLLSESSTPPIASSPYWKTTSPTSFTFASPGNKTIYAWAKDGAGNISSASSQSTTITLPDVIAPTITTFIVPSTSTTLLVSPITLTATDNNGVTGYFLSESTSQPLSTHPSWQTTPPTSFTFSGAGSRILYAWAKDAAGNISSVSSKSTMITLPDVTAPTITTFTVPSTSTTLLVSPITLTATDNVGVTGYFLSESSTQPLASHPSWQATSPTNFIFTSSGILPLYAWAKDAAGNISSISSAVLTITLPDVTAPTITTFSVPSTSTTLLVSPITLTATDGVGVTGYFLSESSTQPLPSNPSWQATSPTSFTFTSAGSKIIYAWAKDAAGNISSVNSKSIVITLPDVTAPTITTFNVPNTSTTLLVSPITLTATDVVGVTGYFLSESSTQPLASNPSWQATSPNSFAFSTAGSVTLYAWTKDAANNVSTRSSRSLTITLPDITAPTITTFSVPSTSTTLLVSPITLTATDSVGVTGYFLSESSTQPLASNPSWQATSPTSFTATSAGSKTIYAWAKDAAGNISSVSSKSITITLPDVTAPIITTFNVPNTSTTLLISPITLTATDSVGVTGYFLSESSTQPLASNLSWQATPPTSFTVTSAGSKILYAWAKDAAGNISSVNSKSTTITLPDTIAPTITAFSAPSNSSTLLLSPIIFTATDNIGVTGYLISQSSTPPSFSDPQWQATAPISYSLNVAGPSAIYAWAKDAAGNVSQPQVISTIACNGSINEATYLNFYADVKAAGINPFYHYLKWGKSENRCAVSGPCTIPLTASEYLFVNQDVNDAGLDPIQHYRDWGSYEGRCPVSLFETYQGNAALSSGYVLPVSRQGGWHALKHAAINASAKSLSDISSLSPEVKPYMEFAPSSHQTDSFKLSNILDVRLTQMQAKGMGFVGYNFWWRDLELTPSSATQIGTCPSGSIPIPSTDTEKQAKHYKRYHCYSSNYISIHDEMIRADNDHSMQVGFVLWSSPSFVRNLGCTGNDFLSKDLSNDNRYQGCVPRDDAMDDFEDYVRFTGDRWNGGSHGKVSHFIVWNEIGAQGWTDSSPLAPTLVRNADGSFNPVPETTKNIRKKKYLRMMKRAHDALKDVTKGIMLYASTDNGWMDQSLTRYEGQISIQEMLESLWTGVDGESGLGTNYSWSVAVHPYGDPSEPAEMGGDPVKNNNLYTFANLNETVVKFQLDHLRTLGISEPQLKNYPQAYIFPSEQGWGRSSPIARGAVTDQSILLGSIALDSSIERLLVPGIEQVAHDVCAAHERVMNLPYLTVVSHNSFQSTLEDQQATPPGEGYFFGILPSLVAWDLSNMDKFTTGRIYQSTDPRKWNKTDSHECCQRFGFGCGTSPSNLSNTLLVQYYNNSQKSYWMTDSLSTAGSGYAFQTNFGKIHSTHWRYSRPLFECEISGKEHFLSKFTNCESTTVIKQLGYISVVPSGSDTSPLYRCNRPSVDGFWPGHYLANACSAGDAADFLGYVSP